MQVRSMYWTNGVLGGSLIYAGINVVSNHEVHRITDQPLLTSIIQKRCPMLFGHLARMDKSANARRILTAIPRVIGKGRQDILTLPDGHNEEWPIISQPQHGRCHRAGTGQTTLEVTGSKRIYALNWCKPSNDDDDDDDTVKSFTFHRKLHGCMITFAAIRITMLLARTFSNTQNHHSSL